MPTIESSELIGIRARRLAQVAVAGLCGLMLTGQASQSPNPDEDQDIEPPVSRAALDQANAAGRTVEVRAHLPSGPHSQRKARVTLRFVDSDLHPRGGASWSYEVKVMVTPAHGSPMTADLKIERNAQTETFESVAILSPLTDDGATLQVEKTVSLNGPLPDPIELEFALVAHRDVAFDPTQKPAVIFDAGARQLKLAGSGAHSALNGAAAYEFEWSYVDDLDPTAGYARDPVRVRSPQPNIPIDLTYSSGRLRARGRALGHFANEEPDSPPDRPGQWSDVIEIPVRTTGRCFLTPQGSVGNCVRPVDSNFNWSHGAAYSESASPLTNYKIYDGSLRNRQSQRVLLSQGEKLVGETAFDREGRGRLSLLPAPASGTTYGFVSTFNAIDAATAGKPPLPYDQQAFDGLSAPPAVSSTSGAGNYYSSSLTAKSPADDYVPSAEGYPYSTTEMARDTTGRPRALSRAGAALRLGGGHDTRFRYASSSSTLLHELFGRNVGLASYYERQLQTDPNGVTHVAYVDQSHRIIATALAGDTQTNITSVKPTLPSWVTYRLDQNNKVDLSNGLSRSASSIVVQGANQNFFFTYNLSSVEYAIPALGNLPKVCQTCQYTLDIHIIDSQGQPVTLQEESGAPDPTNPICSGNQTVAISRGRNMSPNLGNDAPSLQICQSNGGRQQCASTNGAPIYFCATLSDGEYQVIKELRVKNDNLVQTLSTTTGSAAFAAAYATTPANATEDRICGQDCNAFCQEATGDASRSTQPFKDCVTSCQNPQVWAFGKSATHSCDALQNELNADLAPGGRLAGQSPHPEQCHVGICRQRNDPDGTGDPTKSSDAFDDRMMSIEHYADALACGYFNPLQLAAAPGMPAMAGVCPTGQIDHDPVFDAGAFAATGQPAMVDLLTDYSDHIPGFDPMPPPAGPAPSILHESVWQMASDPTLFTDAAHPNGGATPTRDQIWQMFRSLYQSAKHYELDTLTVSGGCAFSTDPQAHVKPSLVYDSIQQIADEGRNLVTDYAKQFCPIRVSQWLTELGQACPGFAGSASAANITGDLTRYCTNAVDNTNLLAMLTNAAIATNPDLKDATSKLPPSCSLRSIARPDPFNGPIVAKACAAGSSSGPFPPGSGLNSDANPLPFFQRCETVHGLNRQYASPASATPAQRLQACRAAADSLASQQSQIALSSAAQRYQYIEERLYTVDCLTAPMQESFSYKTAPDEYHYALHYFDQAGNLVQTVSPAGVRPLTESDANSLDTNPDQNLLPSHGLLSVYRYDSAGRIIWQRTPDSGWKQQWYDDAGQLRLSQTEQQEFDKRYNYIKYDARGRIIESGLVSGLPDLQSIILAAKKAKNQEVLAHPEDELDRQLGIDINVVEFPARSSVPHLVMSQVVTTTYDEQSKACGSFGSNLRGKIASVVAQSSLGDIASCYSYDAHDNVSALLQVVPGLGEKRVDYDHDLLDGRLLATHYQSGQADALHHHYAYDDGRRLVSVSTSRDGVLWEQDAHFAYYRHGLLARLELGADHIQGLDYLYTINGWPKGANSNALDAIAAHDPGGDGRTGEHPAFAIDAFGSSTHYFPGDFRPVASSAQQPGTAPQFAFVSAAGTLSSLAAAGCPKDQTKCGLYDGSLVANVQSVASLSPTAVGFAYRYDQLYRVVGSTSVTNPNLTDNAWPPVAPPPFDPTVQSATNPWNIQVAYDDNGNIRTLNRVAPGPAAGSAGKPLDTLTYHYPTDAQGTLLSNRLLHVNDNAGLVYDCQKYDPCDVDDQGTPFDPVHPNYAYDRSGQLIQDKKAAFSPITWNAAGRISTITRAQDVIEFVYDGFGDRVAKIERRGADPKTWAYEYFVRDEKSRILATYRKDPNQRPPLTSGVTLEEQTLYGAGRLGVVTGGQHLLVAATPSKKPTFNVYARLRGAKHYELANYINNVFVVVKDRKKENPFGTAGPIARYDAEIISAADYDPFGSMLLSRSQSASSVYRYGFSGMERDDELKTAGNSYYTNARLYDPRIGRWLSPDPVAAEGSAFIGFANNPLRFTDPEGRAEEDQLAESPKASAPKPNSRFSLGLDLPNEGMSLGETPMAHHDDPSTPNVSGSGRYARLLQPEDAPTHAARLLLPELPHAPPDAVDVSTKIPEWEYSPDINPHFEVQDNATIGRDEKRHLLGDVQIQANFVIGDLSLRHGETEYFKWSVLHEPTAGATGSAPSDMFPTAGAPQGSPVLNPFSIDLFNLEMPHVFEFDVGPSTAVDLTNRQFSITLQLTEKFELPQSMQFAGENNTVLLFGQFGINPPSSSGNGRGAAPVVPFSGGFGILLKPKD